MFEGNERIHTSPTVLWEYPNLNYNAVARTRENRLFCTGGLFTI